MMFHQFMQQCIGHYSHNMSQVFFRHFRALKVVDSCNTTAHQQTVLKHHATQYHTTETPHMLEIYNQFML
jgi:hypothetical protein